MEVGIILGQDAYELQRPLDYKIGTRSEPFAVLTELKWVVSGPMVRKRRRNVCHIAFTEDVKEAENIQTWWDIETYASKINVVSQSEKELQAEKMLESTKWECCGKNQSQTYQTTTAQPWVRFTHWSEDSKGTQT